MARIAAAGRLSMTGCADASLAAARARYARDVMRSEASTNPRVEAAFATVPRERYLVPPPWRIFSPGGLMDEETSDPVRLYQDVLVVLDRERGINNGQPSLHAAWMAEIDPRPGETAVQIGIGAGYYTAILAALVGESGRVEAYEIEPGLAAIARANLAGSSHVAVHAASGVGTELPKADVVYVAAGAPAPDAAWLRCLRDGGRLIFPWQPDPSHGTALIARRAGRGFAVDLRGGVAFVGCVGAPGEAARRPDRRSMAEIRSLWLTADRAPDESAAALYDEVWFSSQESQRNQ